MKRIKIKFGFVKDRVHTMAELAERKDKDLYASIEVFDLPFISPLYTVEMSSPCLGTDIIFLPENIINSVNKDGYFDFECSHMSYSLIYAPGEYGDFEKDDSILEVRRIVNEDYVSEHIDARRLSSLSMMFEILTTRVAGLTAIDIDESIDDIVEVHELILGELKKIQIATIVTGGAGLNSAVNAREECRKRGFYDLDAGGELKLIPKEDIK